MKVLDAKLLFLSLALTLVSSAPAGWRPPEQETQTRALSSSGENSARQTPDLSSFFADTDGAIVIYDARRDRYLRYNQARCRQRFTPKSTFKVPHSLVGLETGILGDANSVIRWDKEKYPKTDWGTGYPFDHWAQDQSLRSAIKYSVVWYYRELALRVGKRREQEFLDKLQYGNQTIGKQVDFFWLDNSLLISADQQVEFLKKFYTYRLPVSKRSTDIVKDILVLEQTPHYKLSGKTGGGSKSGTGGGKIIGWFVGYVERGKDVYFFALNIDGPNYASIRERRIQLTKQILVGLGYLPEEASVRSQ